MDRNPKRARKKEARDLRVATQEAARRRRRYARIGAVVAALGAVVLLMLYATAGGDDEGSPAAQPTEEKTSEDTPCPAADAPASDPQQYGNKPYPALDQGIDYSAVIRTTCGDIELDLAEKRAPETVANFVFLARQGFYDGLTWHRILGGFVIQSGDPNGRNGEPPDGPGYTVPDELEGVGGKDYRYGTVAMANTGQPDTGGSQFFIVVHDRAGRKPAGLDTVYTIFGEVANSSYDVIDDISRQPVKGGDDPVTAEQPKVPIYIETVDIHRVGV